MRPLRSEERVDRDRVVVWGDIAEQKICGKELFNSYILSVLSETRVFLDPEDL